MKYPLSVLNFDNQLGSLNVLQFDFFFTAITSQSKGYFFH